MHEGEQVLQDQQAFITIIKRLQLLDVLNATYATYEYDIINFFYRNISHSFNRDAKQDVARAVCNSRTKREWVAWGKELGVKKEN